MRNAYQEQDAYPHQQKGATIVKYHVTSFSSTDKYKYPAPK